MLQRRSHNLQDETTKVAALPVHRLQTAFCNSRRPGVAEPRRSRRLFGRHSAQNATAHHWLLKTLCREVLSAGKAMSHQKGKQQCWSLKSPLRLGSARAWQPVATQPANRWSLVLAPGWWGLRSLAAVWSPVPPLAPLQTSSIARKTLAGADRLTPENHLTYRPAQGRLDNTASPCRPLGAGAAFCVSTSRRQRTAHV